MPDTYAKDLKPGMVVRLSQGWFTIVRLKAASDGRMMVVWDNDTASIIPPNDLLEVKDDDE